MLKIFFVFVFPFIGYGQWCVVGGLTLNKPSFTDYRVYVPNGSNPVALPMVVTYESRLAPSFFIGVKYNYRLDNTISLSSEVLYLKRAMRLINETFQYKSFNHLSVPINLNLRLFKEVYLETGPQVDLVLNKDTKFTKKLNYSFNLGINGSLNNKISLGVRINRSLTSDIRPQYDQYYKNLNTTGLIYLNYKLLKNK